MGTFSLHKGSHHLLEAWRKLNAGNTRGWRWSVASTYRRRFCTICPGSMTLRRRVPPTATLDVYREADVLVFPTLADGFGMVVSEAMSQGLPVITTTRAGAAEMITHGGNGLIVPPGDPAPLADALRWCLDHRDALAGDGPAGPRNGGTLAVVGLPARCSGKPSAAAFDAPVPGTLAPWPPRAPGRRFAS